MVIRRSNRATAATLLRQRRDGERHRSEEPEQSPGEPARGERQTESGVEVEGVDRGEPAHGPLEHRATEGVADDEVEACRKGLDQVVGEGVERVEVGPVAQAVPAQVGRGHRGAPCSDQSFGQAAPEPTVGTEAVDERDLSWAVAVPLRREPHRASVASCAEAGTPEGVASTSLMKPSSASLNRSGWSKLMACPASSMTRARPRGESATAAAACSHGQIWLSRPASINSVSEAEGSRNAGGAPSRSTRRSICEADRSTVRHRPVSGTPPAKSVPALAGS